MTTEYRQTLKSSRWRVLKFRRLMHADFRCERCRRNLRGLTVTSAMRRCDLHHRHYRTVGREGLEDVMILCRLCHRVEHDLIPTPESDE